MYPNRGTAQGPVRRAGRAFRTTCAAFSRFRTHATASITMDLAMTLFPPPPAARSRRSHSRPALALLALLVPAGGAKGAVLSEDPGDQTYLTIAINEALETRKTDVEIALRNPDTGSQGTLVIERTYYREPSTPCRDYRRVIERAGAPLSEVRGTGCRIGKAMWSLDEAMVTPSQRGSAPAAKRNNAPASLSPPSAPAPAAKPPAGGRAAAGGGAKAPAGPPPAADAPPPAPPVPSYTLPSRADL
jgi:surface antigen